jgi:hypothetical protein
MLGLSVRLMVLMRNLKETDHWQLLCIRCLSISETWGFPLGYSHWLPRAHSSCFWTYSSNRYTHSRCTSHLSIFKKLCQDPLKIYVADLYTRCSRLTLLNFSHSIWLLQCYLVRLSIWPAIKWNLYEHSWVLSVLNPYLLSVPYHTTYLFVDLPTYFIVDEIY